MCLMWSKKEICHTVEISWQLFLCNFTAHLVLWTQSRYFPESCIMQRFLTRVHTLHCQHKLVCFYRCHHSNIKVKFIYIFKMYAGTLAIPTYVIWKFMFSVPLLNRLCLRLMMIQEIPLNFRGPTDHCFEKHVISGHI